MISKCCEISQKLTEVTSVLHELKLIKKNILILMRLRQLHHHKAA